MVDHLLLFKNRLTGPVPSELGALTGLTSGLRGCCQGLSRPLPSELGRLTRLADTLYFHENEISGTIPSQ